MGEQALHVIAWSRCGSGPIISSSRTAYRGSMAHDSQHVIEFGGSKVDEEFDGTIAFSLIDRIPVITISHTFWAHTARQFRYLMNGSLESEKPIHQQYNWAIADLRMVSDYRDDTPLFLAEG